MSLEDNKAMIVKANRAVTRVEQEASVGIGLCAIAWAIFAVAEVMHEATPERRKKKDTGKAKSLDYSDLKGGMG